MLKLTTLRIFAQVASFVLAISLRNISNEVLGTYAISISVLSIISAIITYEGTFLVISRNIYPSNFYTNLKFNRFIWVFVTLFILYTADLGSIISLCLIGFLLTLDFDYLINLLTLGERAHGKDKIFRSYLSRKIICIEFMLPLLTASAIYYNKVVFLLFLYFAIFLLVNIYMFWIGYKKSKKYPIYKAIPSIKGTTTSFLKRADSQLQRLIIGALFGSAFLGAIYPALLIGRAGSILGNVWYTYYFNRSKQVILAGFKFLRNLPLILLSFLILCAFYSYSAQWFFSTLFDWDVDRLIYAFFFFINLQFFYKTFIRSITTNTRKIYLFNNALALSIGIKLFLAYLGDFGIIGWLFLAVIVDLLIFCTLQIYIYRFAIKTEADKKIKVLRITNLPTEDYPASGLTSHMISKDSNDLLAIPFPKKLCLFEYDNSKIISDLRIDLRNRNNYKWVRFLISIYYSFILSRIASKNKITVVHVHWIPLIFVSLFLRKSNFKFVLTIHGEDARYLEFFPFKQVIKRFSKVYVVGSYWTKYLEKKGFNIEEIPNFSPIEEKTKIKLSKNLLDKKISKSTKNLCLIGSDKNHKNLKIFKEMPDTFYKDLESLKISLNIVGVSEDYYRKVTEINKIPKGIVLLGRKSRFETLSIISNCDLLLIPSFTEGNPKVVWEAVELGTPPIISDSLTFIGYNHKKYPYRFNPNDANGFWEKIKEAILNIENLKLDNYFKISSHLSVRQEYNKIYTK